MRPQRLLWILFLNSKKKQNVSTLNWEAPKDEHYVCSRSLNITMLIHNKDGKLFR